MAKKSVLVTGCSGFLAKYVIEKALEQGYDVRGLDTHDCDMPGIEFVRGSIVDYSTVERAMYGMDYVIHLAAITANTEFTKNPKMCYDINVNGFLNVLEATLRNQVKKIIFASSSAVYHDNFSEDALIDIKQKRDHYAKSKLMNEMMAHSYNLIYNMPVIGVRIFNLYGYGENVKGDYASVVAKFLDNKEKGEKLVLFGDGKQARDLIYVEDAAEIILMLLHKGTKDIYNLGTGEPKVYNDVADAIDKGNKEYVKNPLPSYQYLTKADTKRLREVIGDYKFTDIKTGIKKMIEFRKAAKGEKHSPKA